MNLFKQIAFSILLLLCETPLSAEMRSTVSSEVGSIPKFFHFTSLVGQNRNPQKGQIFPRKQEELKLAQIKLQEFCSYSKIESEIDEYGNEFLMLLPTPNARKNETIILFSNHDRMNLSNQVRSDLMAYSAKIKFLDLSTFDAGTDEINLLFSLTNRLRWLIMPIHGSYNINDINFPSSIEGLVVYNQKFKPEKLVELCTRNVLDNLVFWGCESLELLRNDSGFLKTKVHAKKITLLNSGANLSYIFKSIKFPNLANLTVDDYDLVRRFVNVRSLNIITYHSYRFPGKDDFPVASLLRKDLRNLRSGNYSPIEIKVVSIQDPSKKMHSDPVPKNGN